MKRKSKASTDPGKSGSAKATGSRAEGRDLRLRAEDLRWECPPEMIPLPGRVGPAPGTVGQDRAMRALKVGLALRLKGYNVFVAGPTGTGRTSRVRETLEGLKPDYCPILKDYAYVHNFSDPNAPRLLVFSKGQAREFERAVADLLVGLKAEIPALFEDENFKIEAERIRVFYSELQQKLLAAFEEKLRERGFVLVKVKAGMVLVPQIAPLVQGEPVAMENLGTLLKQKKLTEEQMGRIVGEHERFREEMDQLVKRLNELGAEMMDKFRVLERSAVGKLLDTHISRVDRKFPDPEVHEWLGRVREDVLLSLESFKSEGGEETPSPLKLVTRPEPAPDPHSRYKVNVLLDSAGRPGCPVVVEDVPTWANLIGTVKVDISRMGTLETDHLGISAGSVLRADRGFLVVKALDLFLSPGSWQALKRVLKTGRLEITLPESPLFPGRVVLKPEPVPVDVKVIMIGESYLYDLLYLNDEEFRATFKIKAEFDSEMPLTGETVGHFVSVLKRICDEEKLPTLEDKALGELVEFGVRRAGRRGKLSTRFGDVGDIVREAYHWAQEAGKEQIGVEEIRKAIVERDARHQLMEEKLQDLVEEGRISIEVDGEQVGQVNGLTVLDTGMYTFGRPARITASVSMGKGGLINVEREVGLSGRIYDKGVFIIAGFLRERFAKGFPLSVSASLTFEQSYGAVDGDSASSTEVYALLSALSGVPLKQSIAVTGSVDQKGNIQAVGGVNEKIEGFYLVCKSKGLTGRQGVILPRSNQGDLMLKDEIVEAVREGRYHIWVTDHVDQGIEILTGVPASEVNRKVEERLREFAVQLAQFERGSSER